MDSASVYGQEEDSGITFKLAGLKSLLMFTFVINLTPTVTRIAELQFDGGEGEKKSTYESLR